jgi:hypothetical protein
MLLGRDRVARRLLRGSTSTRARGRLPGPTTGVGRWDDERRESSSPPRPRAVARDVGTLDGAAAAFLSVRAVLFGVAFSGRGEEAPGPGRAAG